VTRNVSKCQSKNFAKWKPTTSNTAKERSRSRLAELVVTFSLGVWLLTRWPDLSAARLPELAKGIGELTAPVTLN
jgi:hypothetical protein